MRCLYCGRQLAFYRRLTGRGEFCSDAHRQLYQDEYNRLALSRLLQPTNSGEEPPAPLPPPTHKLQRRAGSFLDLDEDPVSRPAPGKSAALVHTAASELGPEPPSRVGYLPPRLRGAPGNIAAEASIVPSFAPPTAEIGEFYLTLASPAIRRRSEHCVRFNIEAPAKQPAPVLAIGIDAVPSLAPPECSVPPRDRQEPARVPVLAEKTPIALDRATPAPAATPVPCASTVATAPPLVLPQCEFAPFEMAPLPSGAPAALSLEPVIPAPELSDAEPPCAFAPSFEFASTLETGAVAGLKLGEEQIRFEVPVPDAVADPAPEEPAPFEPSQEDDVLPSEFVAAVQAIDATSDRWTPEPAPEPERGLCPWTTLELTPAPPGTRQRLMVNGQAVGVVATEPGAPDFDLLPARPKFIVGRPPAPASEPMEPVPVAVSAGEVEQTAEETAGGSGVPEPVPVPFEFLQDYDKKGRSALSKLLGRIGLTNLVVF